MACPEYKALLPKYAEGSLVPDQVRLLRDHLPTCSSCRNTIRLLKLDDNAISKMLFSNANQQRQAGKRKRRRLYRSSIFFVVVLLITLAGLYLAYRSVTPPAIEGTPGTEGFLDRRVTIHVEEMAFDPFVALLSREAGIEILMDAEGARTAPPRPPVTLAVQDATLRVVLARLTRTHGLKSRMAGNRILLR